MSLSDRTKRIQPLTIIVVVLVVASLNSAQRPELVVQTGHGATIRALALSNDGELLASSGADKTIIIWELAYGRQIQTLTGPEGWILCLAFSQDKQFLAGGSHDGMVKIWNLTSMKVAYAISSIKPYSITSLAFSPDGNTLAISSGDKLIQLWDMQEGRMKPPLQGHTNEVTRVAFSSDGKQLVSSSLDNTVRMWDLSTATVKRDNSFSKGVTGFAYSPDESLIAISRTDGSIGVVNMNTGDVPAVIPYQGYPGTPGGGLDYRRMRRISEKSFPYTANSLAFVSNSQLAFVDGFKLRVWNCETNKNAISREIDDGDGSYAVAVNAREKSVVYSDGRDIKILDLNTLKERRLEGKSGPITYQVAFSSDGTILAYQKTGGSELWGRSFYSARAQAEIAAKLGEKAAFISSQNLLAYVVRKKKQSSTNITLVDMTNTPRFVLRGHTKAINSITINPEESILASAGNDGKIILWNLKTHQREKTLRLDAGTIKFSPDGKLLALQTSRGIRFLTVPDWKVQSVRLDLFSKFFFSPDSRLLAAKEIGPDRVIKVYEVTGKLLGSFAMQGTSTSESRDTKSTFDPHLSTTFEDILDLYDQFTPFAFSPDSKRLASSQVDGETGNHTIKIWRLYSEQPPLTIKGTTRSIRSLAFSPDGRLLAAGGWDKDRKLWEVDTGKEVATIIPFNKNDWVVYTPDGHFDTNLDLDELNKLGWSWPDSPRDLLSLRVFMRDYFQPSLLQQILTGRSLPLVRDISEMNRTQPLVVIKDVISESADTVQVTLEARNVISRTQKDSRGSPLESGIFDIRLLRDGQVVASSTSADVQAQSPDMVSQFNAPMKDYEADLELWRRRHKVDVDADGTARITFHNIKLPQRDSVKEIEFSAYAFNRDRVTSEMARYVYSNSSTPKKIERRAYVVTVGVDANQSGLSLNFAAESADRVQQLLGQKLSRSYNVINISLRATFQPYSPRTALTNATKENLRAVFDVLAGNTVNAELRQQVPNAAALSKATPDDLVVLYIVSHGYVDPHGNFFVIPYNTGKPVSEPILDMCLQPGSQSPRCNDAVKFIEASISSDDLLGWWRGVDAGDLIMILDTCYAAAVRGRDFKAGPLGDRNFGQLAYDKGMLILCATQPHQTALSTARAGIEGTILSSTLLKNSEQEIFEWLEAAQYEVSAIYNELYPETKSEDIQYPVLLNFSKRHRQTAKTNLNK